MRDDSSMSENIQGPRAGGPVPLRSFTPVQKLEHLTAYEDATSSGESGAYLRGEGLCASQIAEWRKLRNAGVLTGKDAGSKSSRPSLNNRSASRNLGTIYSGA